MNFDAYHLALPSFIAVVGVLLVRWWRRDRGLKTAVRRSGNLAQPALLKELEDLGLPQPESVNYHFTRQCNYHCKFCFHTATTSFLEPLDDAKRGLQMLAEYGMNKVNFSGGEPFLVERGRFVGELAAFCKEQLRLSSVSIVSNGSLITRKWFQKYGKYVDILAVSCDSFDEQTNARIGRTSNLKTLQARQQITVFEVRDLCLEFGVAFKLNTVVTVHNVQEDMVLALQRLNPVRWKVFQCLLLQGENTGDDSLRDARAMTISESEFQSFIDRHRSVATLVAESNVVMRDSYLILDEQMRFLDCSQSRKSPSPSILDAGVVAALAASGFDSAMFQQRGGRYGWTKAELLPTTTTSAACTARPELEW